MRELSDIKVIYPTQIVGFRFINLKVRQILLLENDISVPSKFVD